MADTLAQINVPMNIWIAATPAERDGMYVAAGFDPNLPIEDAGTDGTTLRVRQINPHPIVEPSIVIPTLPDPGINLIGGTTPVMGPGDDLRDFTPVSIGPVAPGTTTDEFGNAIGGTALAIAGRALKIILGGGGGRILAATWNSLPSIARSALTQIGIGVGALIAFNGDIPFITLPGQNGSIAPFDPSQEGVNGVDIQIGGHLPAMGGQLGVHVVGSWNTNPRNPSEGVTFYRLSNGWLAVQNKRGRWKTWKPKRPIVLYADGASNIKTMLRADRALTKQAKQIAAMLNRRAPKTRKSAAKTPNTPIIIESGPGNVITRP